MIMSAKNYSKKKQKRTDRSLGQMVKAKLYIQNHTEKHTLTHSQKEKKEKNFIYIYILKKRATKSINLPVVIRCKY